MNRKHMCGIYVVEFAIIGVLFFILLFAIVEFGRLLFTVNALNESARRGARLAAVCNIDDPHILRTAMFVEGDGSRSSLFGDLKNVQVNLNYLDEAGASSSSNFGRIRFVEITISGFRFNLMIPLPGVGGLLPLQTFRAVLPRESLGRDTETTEPRSC